MVRNGVITNCKQQGNHIPKHHGIQRYCAICKKAVITEKNYMSDSSEKCFGERYDQQSTKDGLVGYLVNRFDAVNQYKNSELKRKKEPKALKDEENDI